MMIIHPISCGFGFAFLIETPQGLFLIDSGSPGQENRVLAKMESLGRNDLKLIWITHAHYDHYGSAAAIRKLTSAPIGIHPDDAGSMTNAQSPLGTQRSYGFIYRWAQPVLNHFSPLLPTPPDFTLENGESLEPFGLNATVLHTPGHTPGHTCLFVEGGIALAGDLLGGFPRPSLQRLLATEWDQLPASLETLRSTHPEWIYTGHSPNPAPGRVLQSSPSNRI
jgi:glyoxylase-like metal-dependent hydrolase (beta-lactamase superfamily II)